MQKINQSVKLVLELAKTQAILSRRFDSGLGGLGLNEFTILYQLSVAADHKLRRVDVARKVGLTASGVTRLLLPMEKIGYVKSGEIENDARARYVVLTSGGRRKMNQAIERMERLMAEALTVEHKRTAQEVTDFVVDLGMRMSL